MSEIGTDETISAWANGAQEQERLLYRAAITWVCLNVTEQGAEVFVRFFVEVFGRTEAKVKKDINDRLEELDGE